MNVNMNEVVTGVTLTKVCSIKPDKDSEESKHITLNVKFDGVTFASVFAKALSGTVIAWQNGVGRKKFDEFKNGQTVDVQFSAPATTAIDPEAAMVAKLQSMTAEEQIQYLKDLAAKAKK